MKPTKKFLSLLLSVLLIFSLLPTVAFAHGPVTCPDPTSCTPPVVCPPTPWPCTPMPWPCTPPVIPEIPDCECVGYTVMYYFDGVLDPSQTEFGWANIGDEISEYEDKCPAGSKLDSECNFPLTVSANPFCNVICVYYATAAKPIDSISVKYAVEYYLENASGEFIKDEARSTFKMAELSGPDATQEVSITPDSISGYTFDASRSVVSGTVSVPSDPSEIVTLKLYYKVNSSSGGGGGGSFTSAAPKLNKADHMAYIVGYPDGTVQPLGNITRAEVATIFFRLLTESSRTRFWKEENDFSDVGADDWFNNPVSTLVNAGIISGYPDGTFRPNAPITRAEMATVIAKFAALDKNGSDFTDIAGHWAEAYIKLAAGNGWITGYPDGTFAPDRLISRAETMTMINRVLERVPADLNRLLPEADMLTFPDNTPADWFYIAVQEATNTHTYQRSSSIKAPDEQWIKLLDNYDWLQLEQ